MKKIALFWIFVLFPVTIHAQQTSTIKGSVLDGHNKSALQGVNVRLLQSKDSTLVKGMLTDSLGYYELKEVPKGDYQLMLSFIGYRSYQENIQLTDNNKSLTIKPITLRPKAQRLQEIEVTPTIIPITIKKDTVTFNASAFKVREGAMVEELLKVLPGIEVDSEGNITYNGEAIERLEVNDRDFFSKDPTMATKNLPSMIIDQVQVIDKQSDRSLMTGVDDGSRTKTLNLRMRKEMNKGWLANVSGGYGTSERYKGDMMLNRFNNDKRWTLIGNNNNTAGISANRGDKRTNVLGLNFDGPLSSTLDLSSSVGYQYDKNSLTGNSHTKNIISDQAYNTNTNTFDNNSHSHRLNFEANMEWKPSKETRVRVNPTLSFSRNFSEAQSAYNTLNNNGEEVNSGQSLRQSNGHQLNSGIDLKGSHRLNDRGRVIYGGLNIDYNERVGDGINRSETSYKASNRPSSIIDHKTENRSTGLSSSLQLSYVEPIIEKLTVQVNYDLSLDRNEDNRTAYNKDANGNYTEIDKVYSRNSYNSSARHRIETSLRYKEEKMRIYVGGQALPTYNHTRMGLGGETTFDKSRTVWNYSPSLRFDLSPNDSLMFALNYRGNTGQPSMEQLSPVVDVTSPLHKRQGNPDLRPSFTHSLRLYSSIGSPTNRMNFSIRGMAQMTDNAIISKRTLDPKTGGSETTYENVSGIKNIYGGFSSSVPLGLKGLSLFINGNLSYHINKAYINNQLNTMRQWSPSISPRIMYNISDFSVNLGSSISWNKVKNSLDEAQGNDTRDFRGNLDLNWNLPWDINFNSNVEYTKRTGYAQQYDKEFCLWNITASKNFLRQRNATIELSINDLLGQRSSFSHNVTSTSIVDTQNNGISTYAMLTFRYRFNSFQGKAPEVKEDTRSTYRRRGRYGAPGRYQRINNSAYSRGS